MKAHFGIKEESKYKTPKVKTKQPSSKVMEYIKLRGISKKTIWEHDIKEKDGNIAFEYYQNGNLVLVKYRTPSKEKKYWQEGGGKPVLWEIDKVDTDKVVTITEGEFDKLALNQAGIENVVSVPFGANNLEWIENCWHKLKKVNQFIIWPDNDDAGKEMLDNVVNRLGRDKCYIVNTNYKDANNMLYLEGEDAVKKAHDNAEPIPVERLLDLKDIKEFDPSKIPAIKSNIPLLNKYLGGYMMGMVTIWTGTNGSGKSTILNQEVLQAIDEGFGTVLQTAELPPWLVRYWLELQAAGNKHLKFDYDEIREKEKPYLLAETKEKIRSWAFDNRLKIYDSFESLKTDKILESFRGAAKQYGIKNFVVDNLMTVNYDATYQEKYNKQSQFVAAMKEFAQNYDCHVHIVAHPRKPKGAVITKEDVAGLYEITNLVDNVIAIHRVTNKNSKALGIDDPNVQNVLDIYKNRIYGKQDISIKLNFDENCKRFCQYGLEEMLDKTYSWEG